MNKLIETTKLVMGSPIIGALATTNGDCDYVSLKNYQRCRIIINLDCGTSPTGAAITLKQATAVAGTNEKALAFSTMYANADCGASDTLVETAVTNNTFTTGTTSDKNEMYVIEVAASDLDVANGFDCLRVDSLLAATSVGTVIYELYGARNTSTLGISAITD